MSSNNDEPQQQQQPRAPTMDEDDENSVTMLDVLKEENELEEDCNAVLGGSDDQNCSYSMGYIRQALYACKTCCGSTRAAVCFACSLHCHEGHDLVELYTKRHTRCDCGNSKFGDKKCSLESSKSAENSENKYNQNYDGVYCNCARPYPDPEAAESDEMIQCCMCEDWYHSKHLGNKDPAPADHDYSEMICAACMKAHDFLWKYATKYSVSKTKKADVSLDESLDTSKKAEVSLDESIDATKKGDVSLDESLDVEEVKKDCSMPEEDSPDKEGSCFWSEGWRASLCSCENCKKLYSDHEISYLLDPLDSVQSYEETARVRGAGETQYEKGMRALASLDRVQQIEAVSAYNKMKENLKRYLQKFAENKKVVREEDILEFFSEMKARKRQKVVVPTFCR